MVSRGRFPEAMLKPGEQVKGRDRDGPCKLIEVNAAPGRRMEIALREHGAPHHLEARRSLGSARSRRLGKDAGGEVRQFGPE